MRWDTSFHYYFLNLAFYDSIDLNALMITGTCSDLNIPDCGSFNMKVGVFLKLVDFFDLCYYFYYKLQKYSDGNVCRDSVANMLAMYIAKVKWYC